MNHYTYFLTAKEPFEGMKYYIGVRSCECAPEEDEYMGSSRVIKRNKVAVDKHILATWSTREEAVSHEILLHECFDVALNGEFFNQAKQKTTGFDTTGMKFKFNVEYTPERREQMRKAAKKRMEDPAVREKIRKARALQVIPREVYERQAKVISSLVWLNDGVRSYRVRPELVDEKLNNGLVHGRLMTFMDSDYKKKCSDNATRQWQAVRASGKKNLRGT
jgi:hypothetical protein